MARLLCGRSPGGKPGQGGCSYPFGINSWKATLLPKGMLTEWAPSAPTLDLDWSVRPRERPGQQGIARQARGSPAAWGEQEGMRSLVRRWEPASIQLSLNLCSQETSLTPPQGKSPPLSWSGVCRKNWDRRQILLKAVREKSY